jgi:hypothetical protein
VPKDVPDWTTGTDIPWVPVGTHTTVGVGVESFTTTAVLPSTRYLAIDLESSAFGLTGVNIIGHQSGTGYVVAGSAATSQNHYVFRVNGALDSTFDIQWATSSGAGVVVAAFASSQQEGYPNLGGQPGASSLPVVIASDSPVALNLLPSAASTPWLVPNQGPKQVALVIAAGATSAAVIAGVVGQSIYLFGVSIAYDAIPAGGVASLDFETDLPFVLHSFDTNVNPPPPFEGFGVKLPGGAAVQFKNNAGAQIIVRGSIVFSQA